MVLATILIDGTLAQECSKVLGVQQARTHALPTDSQIKALTALTARDYQGDVSYMKGICVQACL